MMEDMSKSITVTLPKLGESILSATVLEWFKKEGEMVDLDEALLEVSTDKVNSEIPSPIAGRIEKICVEAGVEVNVGDPLAIIVEGASSKEPSPKVEVPKAHQAPETSPAAAQKKHFLTPAVLRLAKEHGISASELERIAMEGTGAGGRLMKKDLETYLAKQHGAPTSSASSAATLSPKGETEAIKMSGMRKAIAENMVRSFYGAPHATLVTEVDVTHVLKTIAQNKETFLAQHGVKLTITSFVARAIARAIEEYPLVNSKLEDDTIMVKHFVNLGLAVSVGQGLMVPVIRGVQGLSLSKIAAAIKSLSIKAREGTIQPDDVKEGTITLTNFGMSGVEIGVPIIRYPEVAIIGMGATKKRVAVLEDDTMAVRSMMHISLTFDHRVLDGMYGCGFLAALEKHLTNDTAL